MMEPTLREDRKATQDALDAIDYMGIGPRFGIILEAISAARERGAREQAEREPLHRAIVEAAMRWAASNPSYSVPFCGPEQIDSGDKLRAAVRALREATR